VLISATGRAQLVDFGLAAVTQGADDESANPRTIDYAGLERATGVRKDDPRSDVFFNGCMFYQMLAGVPPLSETRDRLHRLSNSRYQDVKPVSEIDPDLPRRIVMIVRKAMELNPEKRYQTQTEMLADLRVTRKRLKEGDLADGDDLENGNVAAPLGPTKSVMIVESNPNMQDVFRRRLKKEGYRVLVMRNPSLAALRFEQEPNVADCVVFSCLDLGSQGVEAFNQFGRMAATKHIPAILLLDKKQQSWKDQADQTGQRVVLTMPVKMKQLREILRHMLQPAS
jgi:serine/threonine protein kinase